MVSIDVSKIEGYDKMTPEEKVEALERYELEIPKDKTSSELERYKNAASKANSEAAEWKRKHNALLSEEEKKQQESLENLERMKAELEQLKRSKNESENRAKLIGLGYDEELADLTAKAISAGETEKVFEYQKQFNEKLINKVKSEALKDTPQPVGDSLGQTDVTPEQFSKMGYSERSQLFKSNPEQYNKLIGGNI